MGQGVKAEYLVENKEAILASIKKTAEEFPQNKWGQAFIS